MGWPDFHHQDVYLPDCWFGCFSFSSSWMNYWCISATDRVHIVYPWRETYFGTFGDIFTNTSILNNPKVAHHGKVVLRSIDKAVRIMDRIQETHAALSRLHYECVDPDNFKVGGRRSEITDPAKIPCRWDLSSFCFICSCWETASPSPLPANSRKPWTLRSKQSGRSSSVLWWRPWTARTNEMWIKTRMK